MTGVGKPFENAVILVAVGVVAIIINTLVITRWRRRRVFLTVGLTLCGIVQLIIAAVYDARPTKDSTVKLIVGLSVVYILSYNGAYSPLKISYRNSTPRRNCPATHKTHHSLRAARDADKVKA